MSPRDHAQQAANGFPARLRAARKLARLTQDQLAAKASLSPIAISKFETGVNLPQIENLMALAFALNTSPNALLGWETPVFGPQTGQKKESLARLLLAAEPLSVDWIDQLIEVADRARTNS